MKCVGDGDRTKSPRTCTPPTLTPRTHTPPVTYPLDTYPLDTYPLGHIPPGHLPPGHLPPGHLPPRTYTTQDIYPPHFKMPYLVHASWVDYILDFKQISIYFAERTVICDVGAIKIFALSGRVSPHNYSGFR